MAHPIPSQLALASIQNTQKADATPVQGNFAEIAAAVNALIVALDGGTIGQFLEAQDSSDVQYAYPPGYEISYTSLTSPVTVTGLTSGAATPVIAPGAVTFDGSPVWVEVFAPLAYSPSGANGDSLTFGLFESGALISQLGLVEAPGGGGAQDRHSVMLKQRLTPTAATHTYTLACWVTDVTGTPQVLAGSGAAGNLAPAYLRFVKA